MSDDKEKRQDKDESQDQPKTDPMFNPQYMPPHPATGTMYNYPSGSAAGPTGGQAAVLGQALSNLQSLTLQREPNPEVMKYQYEAVMRVSDNFKEENIRQIEYNESRDKKQHDIISKQGSREFTITLIALGVIVAIMFVGGWFLFEQEWIAGASLMSGGLGMILGYLGGMGVSKKLAG